MIRPHVRGSAAPGTAGDDVLTRPRSRIVGQHANGIGRRALTERRDHARRAIRHRCHAALPIDRNHTGGIDTPRHMLGRVDEFTRPVARRETREHARRHSGTGAPLDVIHWLPNTDIAMIRSAGGNGETGGAGGGVGAVGVELLHALKPRAKSRTAALMTSPSRCWRIPVRCGRLTDCRTPCGAARIA